MLSRQIAVLVLTTRVTFVVLFTGKMYGSFEIFILRFQQENFLSCIDSVCSLKVYFISIYDVVDTFTGAHVSNIMIR